MKKVSFLVAIAAASIASCTAQSPKAELNNGVDSLSYSFGLVQTNGLKEHLTGRLGIDTAYIADFVKGVQDGAYKEATQQEKAYHAGKEIGQMISEQWIPGFTQQVFGAEDTISQLNKDNIIAGFIAGTLGKGEQINMMEATQYLETNMQAIRYEQARKQYAANIEAGEKFLAENKTKEGVQTTASGLQYKIIKQGNGPIPADTSRVKVHYRGTLLDGTEFDSSYKRNKPMSFEANRVIKGWTEALTMMPVGSKWELYIPSELGYGAEGSRGKITPFSTLIFEVELLDIEK